MIIHKLQTPHASNDIVWAIQFWLSSSRFYADVTPGRRTVKIMKVRLREKKSYCGNHPKACERAFHGKHKRMDYLEGADWVEFNDNLNDILDYMGVVCDVKSATCYVRQGRCRRVFYDANTQQADGNWQWDMDGPASHYADNCGGQIPYPCSEFPFGTPGIYTRANYFCVGGHDHEHDH
jgi:hypothetical protein